MSAPASRTYPGSPSIIAAHLRADDRAHLYELEAGTFAALERQCAGDARLVLHHGDGLAGLPAQLEQLDPELEVLVHIDPTYAEKREWTDLPSALVAAHAARPATRFAFWYPVKSYTRPNAMLLRLGKTAMPGVTLELITTPLELQRNRLNGSGMLLVNAPLEVLTTVTAAAPVLGMTCATHHGKWTSRCIGWQGQPGGAAG